MITLIVYGIPVTDMAYVPGGFFASDDWVLDYVTDTLHRPTSEVLNLPTDQVSIFLPKVISSSGLKRQNVVCLVGGISGNPEWISQILDKLSDMLINCISELIRKLLPENQIKVKVVIE